MNASLIPVTTLIHIFVWIHLFNIFFKDWVKAKIQILVHVVGVRGHSDRRGERTSMLFTIFLLRPAASHSLFIQEGSTDIRAVAARCRKTSLSLREEAGFIAVLEVAAYKTVQWITARAVNREEDSCGPGSPWRLMEAAAWWSNTKTGDWRDIGTEASRSSVNRHPGQQMFWL